MYGTKAYQNGQKVTATIAQCCHWKYFGREQTTSGSCSLDWRGLHQGSDMVKQNGKEKPIRKFIHRPGSSHPNRLPEPIIYLGWMPAINKLCRPKCNFTLWLDYYEVNYGLCFVGVGV